MNPDQTCPRCSAKYPFVSLLKEENKLVCTHCAIVVPRESQPAQVSAITVIHLPLNFEYFDQIAAGTKTEEYRLVNPYWRKRLEKEVSGIVLRRGYTQTVMFRPWRGYIEKTITHPHFGPNPVHVFAIDVRPA